MREGTVPGRSSRVLLGCKSNELEIVVPQDAIDGLVTLGKSVIFASVKQEPGAYSMIKPMKDFS